MRLKSKFSTDSVHVIHTIFSTGSYPVLLFNILCCLIFENFQ